MGSLFASSKKVGFVGGHRASFEPRPSGWKRNMGEGAGGKGREGGASYTGKRANILRAARKTTAGVVQSTE
jgi:hypothetical protein